MEKIVIKGGHELHGDVYIHGMKNAALPIIFATILTADKCVIENVPLVNDITMAFEILESMGAKITYQDKTTVEIDTTELVGGNTPFELVSKMRGSTYLLGAELARFQKTAEECHTEQERMLYLLKNIGSMKIQPECFESQTYGRIFEACRLAGFSEEKRIKYDSDMNDERRLKGEFAAAEKKGWEKGLEEAIRKMISAGMTVDQVASIMELPVEQVQAFKHD